MLRCIFFVCQKVDVNKIYCNNAIPPLVCWRGFPLFDLFVSSLEEFDPVRSLEGWCRAAKRAQ